MKLDAAGRRFITGREGFFSFAYDDANGRPWSVSRIGTKTIGYGTTESDVSPLPNHVTRAQGAALFMRAMETKYEPAIEPLFREGGPLHGKFTQSLFNALASFVYNLGPFAVPRRVGGRWQVTPGFETIGRAIMAGDVAGIARALPLYRNPGSVWEQGLLARRNAEAAMVRRRPRQFEDFTAEERRWIEEYDRLKARPTRASVERRRELRRLMTRQRKRIWAVAKRDRDWWSRRRRQRYDALLRRTR